AVDEGRGKEKWAFDRVAKAGEVGADTWEENSNGYTGNTGVWAPISVDPELGYAYLPVESPTNDYYGGHRRGSNLFANSVVCVDIETGKRIWHYQITHHEPAGRPHPLRPRLPGNPSHTRPSARLTSIRVTPRTI